MSAKTLPYQSRRVYNEIGIEREGILPDYIIIEEDMAEEVKKNSYRAASQYGIPVVFLDKELIVQRQQSHLMEMLKEFEESQDPEQLKAILNTYETNVAGWLLNRSGGKDTSFTKRIDYSRFQPGFDQVWEHIQSAFDQYLAKEPDQLTEQEVTRVMEIVLEERDLYAESQEAGPITKTAFSFDAMAILGKINQTLEKMGSQSATIDLEHIPTAQEYRISMRKLMENALKGENAITTEDVVKADQVRQEITKEKEEKEETK